LDTGAAMYCVGYRQARVLRNLNGVPYELSTGTQRFKFGDVVSEPYGILNLPLRTPGGIVPLPIHVVPQNVPLLIGADILDAQQWYIRNVSVELVPAAGWTLPIARWQGHYWLRHGFDELPASTRFTRTQLYHLHRYFRHPGVAKMHELLKRTKAEDLSPDTLAVLQDISEHFRSCQVFRNKEVAFSSRLKGDAVFNRSIEMDLCYIHRFPSRIVYNGQTHQVRFIAFRSLFVKKSNHGASVGHFCSGVGIGLYRHAGCGNGRSGYSVHFKRF
jgi:hypothetical protein